MFFLTLLLRDAFCNVLSNCHIALSSFPNLALQLEENGQLASLIVRDPSGNAEFIDGEGIAWDVKQFHSEQGRFNLEKAVAVIDRELRAGENVTDIHS